MANTSTKPRKPAGRPPLYDAREQLIEQICVRLATGEPLAQICRDEGMPADRTVRLWCQEDTAIAAAIARAREMGEDALAEQCLEIADDARNDWMERQGEDGGEGWRLNGDHVQRSKLRIETRLKLLAKWNPKKYGDKVSAELSGPAGGPIQLAAVDLTRLTTDQLRQLKAMAEQARVIEAQASESEEES